MITTENTIEKIQITNSKLQIKKEIRHRVTKAQRKINHKNFVPQCLCAYKLVIWSLEFIWNLVLGAWNFLKGDLCG